MFGWDVSKVIIINVPGRGHFRWRGAIYQSLQLTRLRGVRVWVMSAAYSLRLLKGTRGARFSFKECHWLAVTFTNCLKFFARCCNSSEVAHSFTFRCYACISFWISSIIIRYILVVRSKGQHVARYCCEYMNYSESIFVTNAIITI